MPPERAAAPDTLRLRRRHVEAIRRHGAATLPEECCGILIGRREGRRTIVERVVETPNGRRDRPRDRFEIPPGALLEAQRQARAEGLDMVGYYHSHPVGAAVPSATDRQDAWPGVSYLILDASCPEGELRSWRLPSEPSGTEAADHGFVEEALVLDDEG